MKTGSVIVAVAGAWLLAGCIAVPLWQPAAPPADPAPKVRPASKTWEELTSKYRKKPGRLLALRQDQDAQATALSMEYRYKGWTKRLKVMFDAEKYNLEERRRPKDGGGQPGLFADLSVSTDLLTGEFEVTEGTVYVVAESGAATLEPSGITAAAAVPQVWPIILTKRIGIGVEGTRFIVHIDPAGDEMVFPLEGTVWVGIIGSSEAAQTLADPNQYFRYSESTGTPRLSIEPMTEPLSAFIESVVAKSEPLFMVAPTGGS
jgi:hypothetical protein